MRGVAVVAVLLGALVAAVLLGTDGPAPAPAADARPTPTPTPTPAPAPTPTFTLPPTPDEPFSPPRAVAAALDGCRMTGPVFDVRWHVDLVGGTSWTSGGPGEHTRTGDRIDYRGQFDARFFTIDAAVVTSLVDGRREVVPLPTDARPSYQLSEVCT